MEQLGLGETLSQARAPLPERLRPQRLDDVIGQPQLTGPRAALRLALQAGKPYSFILWGPPGTGKTTIAMAVARETSAAFEELSAVTHGIKDLKDIISRAQQRRRAGQQTLLFIDEIARWNRAQQDALLPFVENGTVVLVGATTEHPGVEINTALLSRLKIEQVHALDEAAQRALIERALTDAEAGLAPRPHEQRGPYTIEEDAIRQLLTFSGGDARSLLRALEAASILLPEGGTITPQVLDDAVGYRQVVYDRSGDQHYDLASALIKSIRGSDVDAALYWLARMQAGGEDPKFIARRLVISASEDIGMGAPGALAVATAGMDAVQQVGPPECFINLAHIVVYLATRPKDWSAYEGLRAAQQVVAEHPPYPVPAQLRNASNQVRRQPGDGKGYVHASQAGAEEMEFLPPELRGVALYRGPGH